MYTVPWNEGVPISNDPANAIHTYINNTKTAVRERLVEVIPDFDDDDVQPKLLKPGSARIFTGNDSERPSTPPYEDAVWYSKDTKLLYIAVDGAWEQYPQSDSNFAALVSFGSLIVLGDGVESSLTHVISWDAPIINQGGVYNSSNPTRLTVPSSAKVGSVIHIEFQFTFTIPPSAQGSGYRASATIVPSSIAEGGPPPYPIGVAVHFLVPESSDSSLGLPKTVRAATIDVVSDPGSQYYVAQASIARYGSASPAGAEIQPNRWFSYFSMHKVY